MRFRHCPDCGAILSARNLGDEIDVPWCDKCGKPWFEMFSTCVIGLVCNSRNEVLLQRQAYISTKYMNLVSGYMKPGETAEGTMRREIEEETGLEVESLRYAGSWWFARKDMLMLGFIAKVHDGEPHPSVEVDSAEWHTAADAVGLVHPEGSVSHALCDLYLKSMQYY